MRLEPGRQLETGRQMRLEPGSRLETARDWETYEVRAR